MKIKVILTIGLIIVCFWVGIHFAEKKQKDLNELYELKEKYKNNYDSIYLSDLQIIYKEKSIGLTNTYNNWVNILGNRINRTQNFFDFIAIDSTLNSSGKRDSLFMLSVIKLYDNTEFSLKLPRENKTIEAYQEYDDYTEKYPKSYIHSREAYTGRRSRDRINVLIIYNKDTMSNIAALALLFAKGQMM